MRERARDDVRAVAVVLVPAPPPSGIPKRETQSDARRRPLLPLASARALSPARVRTRTLVRRSRDAGCAGGLAALEPYRQLVRLKILATSPSETSSDDPSTCLAFPSLVFLQRPVSCERSLCLSLSFSLFLSLSLSLDISLDLDLSRSLSTRTRPAAASSREGTASKPAAAARASRLSCAQGPLPNREREREKRRGRFWTQRSGRRARLMAVTDATCLALTFTCVCHTREREREKRRIKKRRGVCAFASGRTASQRGARGLCASTST